MPGFLAEVLTWNENYHITLAIETALDLKMPPTGFILTKDSGPEEAWSGLDKKLAIAFNLMNKETCGKCGQPIWICRNSDRNIDFSVKVATCHASAALEKAEESRSKRKNGKLKAGQYLYLQAMQVNGEPIPKGTRANYFETLSEE